MDRRQAMMQLGVHLPDRVCGAALFADISGFTPLANTLATHSGPQRGAEELTRRLNQVYTVLIDQIHRYRGSVIGFVGDAITCWFDADNGLRATACALAMQTVMQPFASLQITPDLTATFAIKIGIAAGTARRFRVGDPQIQYIDVLAGDLLNRMSRAEGAARKGEILLDATTAGALESHVAIAGWQPHPHRGGRYAVVTSLSAPIPPAPWPALDTGTLPPAGVRAWVLAPIYERLKSGQQEFLAELRPATSLFLKFGGLDYDNDPSAGDKLDAYIRWVQKTANHYEGYLIQLTVGDKGSFLYVAFGAPTAHDDDVVRAVRTGWALLTPPAKLSFITGTRIGIAQGQARTGAYGSPTRRAYGVISDDVVLAARLMDIAPAGEIRCAYSVYHQAGSHIAFDELPPVRVKGRAELVRAYRPVALRATPRGAATETETIIGRQREIAHLRATFEATLAGESRVLIVEGEAGIGKSRLVAELTRLIRERGLTYLSGSGQSIEQQTPYRAWRDIFTAYFDIGGLVDLASRRKKIRISAGQIVPGQRQYLPLLNDLLNVDLPENDLTQTLNPQARQQALILLVAGLLRAWTRERPLILVVEDAQWLDSLSWQLIEQITRSLAISGAPFLCLVVTRPMDTHSTGARHLASLRPSARAASSIPSRLRVETLALTALSPAEAVAVAASRLELPAGRLPKPVATLVEERAEGNPFFAEELVLALRSRGVIALQTVDGQRRCTVSADLTEARQTLPNTIHGLVLARIDRLPPEPKLTLKVASVIGRTFAYDLLRAALREHTTIDDVTLRTHLNLLDTFDLTSLATIHPRIYAFKHIITQETAYQTLLFTQRRSLHRTVARTIEQRFAGRLESQVELLAYHWERGERTEEAVRYLIRSGERTRNAYANDEAIAHFRHALDLLSTHDITAQRYRFEALRGLGQTYFAMPDMVQAEQCFRQALAVGKALSLDIDEQVRVYHWLGEALWWQNRSADQVEVGLQALALLGENPAPSEALALANQTVAVGYINLGRMDQFYAYTGRTASFIEQLPYSEELRPAFVHIIVGAQENGELTKARRWLDVLEERAAQHGDLRAVAEGHYLTGNLLAAIGQMQKAISRYHLALDLYIQIRDVKFQVWCLKGLGTALLTLGQLQEAAQYAGRAIERSVEADNKHIIAENRFLAGTIALAQGSFTQAERYFLDAIRTFRALKSYPWQTNAMTHLARTYLAAGKRQAALAQFQKALLRIHPTQAISDAVGAISGLETAYRIPQAFRKFCARYRMQHPETNDTPFQQWFLEPGQPRSDCGFPIFDFGFDAIDAQNPKSTIQNGAWNWVDPLGDCNFTAHDGLTIYAANGRSMWKSNQSAPRIVRTVSGDFNVQTVCEPAYAAQIRPAVGGLLLWLDAKHFLRIDRGRFGPDEVLFSGNLNGQPRLLGRGHLHPDNADRIHLRLERFGDRVRALCSADGKNWFTAGQANFPAANPVHTGVFAVGSIDRAIYPGAYPDGTAIRFTSFQLWATIQDTESSLLEARCSTPSK